MGTLSRREDYQLRKHRRRKGTTVRLLVDGVEVLNTDGNPFTISTEEVSGAEVGAQLLPRTAGPYIASADPRVFIFSPRDFLPTTTIDPPIEGNELVWHNLKYRITRVNYDDSQDDTHSINVYVYREIFNTV